MPKTELDLAFAIHENQRTFEVSWHNRKSKFFSRTIKH